MDRDLEKRLCPEATDRLNEEVLNLQEQVLQEVAEGETSIFDLAKDISRTPAELARHAFEGVEAIESDVSTYEEWKARLAYKWAEWKTVQEWSNGT